MTENILGMKKGFTLVELSIVLVIIGLLIGGILVAQSIIDTARLTKTVSDIEQFEILTKNFKDVYRNYPGDLPGAYGYFGATCGDNWGKSGIPFQLSGCNGSGDGFVTSNPAETDNFWQQLSLSQILPLSFSSLVGDQAYKPGLNVPRGQFKNSMYTACGNGGECNTGNLPYGLTLASLNISNLKDDSNFLLTPTQAYAIDKKIDDSIGNTGFVIDYRSAWGSPPCHNTSGVYYANLCFVHTCIFTT